MKLPSGRKAILLLGLPLGLAVGGALAYTQLAAGNAPPPEVPDPTAGQQGVLLALDERVVNLATGGSYRYAKIGVTIELRPEAKDFYALQGEARAAQEKTILKEYDKDLPVLLDSLGTVVGAKTSDQIATPDGRAALKAQLLDAFRGELGPKAVLNLYFTDLVMQ